MMKNMRFSNNTRRIRLEKEFQREFFEEFIKKFESHNEAAGYLNITKWNMSSYLNCKTRYVPEEIINRVSSFLNKNIDSSKIEFVGNLTEIRKIFCISKTFPVLRSKYGKNWGKILTKNARQKLYQKYGDKTKEVLWNNSIETFRNLFGENWREVISRKGMEALEKKYGKNWYDITLKKGRETLRNKYGNNWQKQLSNLAMESLEKKYGKDFRKKMINVKKMMKSLKLTDTEQKFVDVLDRNGIAYETHCFINGSEFDVLIPNSRNPEIICEITNQKQATRSLRRKLIQLHFQTKVFPKAKVICIFRKHGKTQNNKSIMVKPAVMKFLIDNDFIIFWTDQMDKTVKCIRDYINSKQNPFLSQKLGVLKEMERYKRLLNASKGGSACQSKKANESELVLNDILKEVGNPQIGKVLYLSNGDALTVDNYEEINGIKLVYEITSTKDKNAIMALAGKLFYLKRQIPNIKTIVILNSIKKLEDNYSTRSIKEFSDAILLANMNKKEFAKARNQLLFE